MAYKKVLEVVIDALEDILVLQEEEPVPQAESLAAIRYLNDMMAEWEADGIDLDYTEVSNLGEDVTVALGAIKGIKSNLSVALASKYDVTVPLELERAAKKGYRTCVSLGLDLDALEFPNMLPTGSGNKSVASSFFPGADTEEEEETTTTTTETSSGAVEQYVNEDETFLLTTTYDETVIFCYSSADQAVEIYGLTVSNTGFKSTIIKVGAGDVTVSLPGDISGLTWGDGSTGDIKITTLNEKFELHYNAALNKIFFSYAGAYDQS